MRKNANKSVHRKWVKLRFFKIVILKKINGLSINAAKDFQKLIIQNLFIRAIIIAMNKWYFNLRFNLVSIAIATTHSVTYTLKVPKSRLWFLFWPFLVADVISRNISFPVNISEWKYVHEACTYGPQSETVAFRIYLLCFDW